MKFLPYKESKAHLIITQHKDVKGGLIVALRDLADTFGYIAPSLFDFIAETFSVSAVEVKGVVTYYHDFKTEKRATNVVQVCMAEACYARGSSEMIEELKNVLNIDIGEKDIHETFEIEPVYCFGNCGTGPTIRINERIFSNINKDNVRAILRNYRMEEEENE